MKTLNVIPRIRGINIVLGDETPSIGAKDTVHCEATRETQDTAKRRLECFFQLVIGVIFKDWEKKKEGEEWCFSETIIVTQPPNLLYDKRYRYIYDSYIQLTLQHCDETLILIFNSGFSAKS